MPVKRIAVAFLIFQVALLNVVRSQTMPTPDLTNINPPSPNAASLGEFGTYPTTLYNGLVHIAIPVYDIKTPRLDVPISISYHASGIRVADVASWVGLGWALDCGGEITRHTLGNVDERQDGYLTSGNTIKLATNLSPTTSNSDIQYLLNLVNKQMDGEPDLFSFMFPGGSGNFLFDTDKVTLIHLPLDKIKITANIAGNQFTLLDQQGNTYIFGQSLAGQNDYETSTTYSSGASTFDVSAWMLTDMVSADKSDTIFFKYFTTPSLETYEDIYNYMTVSDDHTGVGGCNGSCFYKSDEGYDTETQGTSYTENSECKLSEIDFKNGKVTFSRASSGRLDQPGDTALQKITVYNYDYSTHSYQAIKTVTLFQSYYNHNDRLRLDSMQVTGTGIANIQTYSFAYTSTNLPAVTSVQKDYWGYYNSNNGITLLPQMQFYYSDQGGPGGNITIGDADRSADTSRVKACTLEKIYYPTGGYTQFVYESNRFMLNNNLYYGGGLRIAEILNWDGLSSNPQITYYKYGDNQSGYGDFNEPATSLSGLALWSSVAQYQYYPKPDQPVETILRTTFSSTPNFDFAPLDGSSVFYPAITVYQGDSTGMNGKKVYQYEYSGDLLNFDLPNAGRSHTQSYIWRRGHLLSKTVFDKYGNPLVSV